MKKILSFFSFLFIFLLIVGCGNGEIKKESTSNSNETDINVEEQSGNSNFLCGVTNDFDYTDLGTIDYEQFTCLKNQKNIFVLLISQTTCGYCYMIKPHIQNVVKDYRYNHPIYVLNVNELTSEQKQDFLSSIDYLQNTEKWGTPLLLAIKEQKSLAEISGYTDDKDKIEEFFNDAGLNKY